MLRISIETGLKQMLMMTYRSASVAVEITKLINKRELSKADNSFDILIRYLEYTGMFDSYFNQIAIIHDDIITMTDAELTDELNQMLEIFDNDKIESFLTRENYASPSNLIDEFSNDIILNREGSREQTYTKKDYRDLVVLSIKFKALSMILARYVAIHDLNINGAESVKLYRVVNNLSNINTLPAYKKLIEYINKNIAGDESITQDDIARILNKNITNTQFASYITLSVIIYISIAASSDGDTPVRNMVNEVFRLCRNKTASTKNIIVNDPGISIDDEGGSSSVTDTYLSLTEIPIGYVEEFLICYGSMDLILAQITIPIDLKYLEEVEHLRPILIDKQLDLAQTAVLAWLYTDVIESNYLKYFDRDIILNFRLAAYALLKTHNLNELANIMLGTVYESGGYLSKSAVNTAAPELEEKLDSMYSLSINKKSRNRRYGLSILEDSDTVLEDSNLKELFIRPVVRRLSTTKWLCYNLPKDSNIISVTNIRTELIQLQAIVYDSM
jgi:hypothetical protein